MPTIKEGRQLLQRVRRICKGSFSKRELETFDFLSKQLDQLENQKKIDPVKVAGLLLLIVRLARPLLDRMLE